MSAADTIAKSALETLPEETQQAITTSITERVRGEFEVDYARRIAEHIDKLTKANEEKFEAELEQYRASLKPPTTEEIQKLLEQEYATFKVTLPWGEGTKEFVIRELPQSLEKKFYNMVKKELAARAGEIGSLAFQSEDLDRGGEDVLKKIQATLEAFEPTFDLLAEACAMSLDPQKKNPDINREWVQNTLSSWRIWNVVLAQVQCNRLRDFLSQLFRASSGMGTVSPAGIQK